MALNLIIGGSGFAGTWAALAAARAIHLAGARDAIAVTVVSPSPNMVIRPRLYESQVETSNPDIAPLLDAVGVHHLAGRITAVDADARRLQVRRADGTEVQLGYDSFVLATGSELVRPAIPGLLEHAFDMDQLAGARKLAAHLQSLAARPSSPARNTVVVAGGGFTGIEGAAEMPERLRSILGASLAVRTVLVERAPVIGPDLGPGPRDQIIAALAACGVEVVTGATIDRLDGNGVWLSTGEHVAAQTVVWTAGVRASALAAQFGAALDPLGRILADSFLRIPSKPGVFVAGDTAHAATDGSGNVALMSCQHALSLGRVAGYNAAAMLLGLDLHAYSQARYVTCLDLGAWGAVLTEGWERKVVLSGQQAKDVKREINTKWIYPPPPDRELAFATANPDHVIVP